LFINIGENCEMEKVQIFFNVSSGKGNKNTLIKSTLCALCVKPLRSLRLKIGRINRKVRKGKDAKNAKKILF